MISVRPVTLLDASILFRWRNDPDTIAASRNARPISPAEHKFWMNIVINNPEHRQLMFEENGVPIGTVRFDDRDKGAEVGITVSPDYRGKGYGFRILRMATKDAEIPLIAEIRRSNTASKRIFERCQFVELGGDGDFVLFKKDAP